MDRRTNIQLRRYVYDLVDNNVTRVYGTVSHHSKNIVFITSEHTPENHIYKCIDAMSPEVRVVLVGNVPEYLTNYVEQIQQQNAHGTDSKHLALQTMEIMYATSIAEVDYILTK